jgi:hypothetical protein
VVDEDAAHGLGAGGEEVAARVPPLNGVSIHQSEVRFMDERRRLQGLSRLFSGQLRCRQFAQFVVDEWQQSARGAWVALLDAREDSGDLAHGDKVYPRHVEQAPVGAPRTEALRATAGSTAACRTDARRIEQSRRCARNRSRAEAGRMQGRLPNLESHTDLIFADPTEYHRHRKISICIEHVILDQAASHRGGRCLCFTASDFYQQ